ncbi:MAG: aldo/keto reductase, partial [Chloroflexi bacterium]|nr:aldo/keto reductase [Chloroflexota bacterium]
VIDIVERIVPLAEARGCTVAQYALAWTMAQPGVTAPITGPRTLEQFEDNLGAIDVELEPEDFAAMDGAIAPGEYAADFFEASFTPNQHRVW